MWLPWCGKRAKSDLIFQPSQHASEPTPDLAEIQTRYLRCMIGLDTDTSGLGKVSCSACNSDNLHVPHYCKILRDRMHSLMLHVRKAKSVVEHSVKLEGTHTTPVPSVQCTPPKCKGLPDLGVHSVVTLPSPKSSMQQAEIMHFNQSSCCSGSVETSSSSKNETNSLDSMSILKETSFKSHSHDSLIVQKEVYSLEAPCGGSSSTSHRDKPSGKVLHLEQLSAFSQTNSYIEPTTSRDLKPVVDTDVVLATTHPHFNVKSINVDLTISTQELKNKSNLNLSKLFKMLEIGIIQVQCPKVSSHSMRQMTTLQELERQVLHQHAKCSSNKFHTGTKYPSERKTNHQLQAAPKRKSFDKTVCPLDEIRCHNNRCKDGENFCNFLFHSPSFLRYCFWNRPLILLKAIMRSLQWATKLWYFSSNQGQSSCLLGSSKCLELSSFKISYFDKSL